MRGVDPAVVLMTVDDTCMGIADDITATGCRCLTNGKVLPGDCRVSRFAPDPATPIGLILK
jgi:hypothetical protein